MMMTKVIERLGKIETGRNSFDMNRLSLKQEVSEAEYIKKKNWNVTNSYPNIIKKLQYYFS